jgi:PAS domain S-box-containing protein
MRPRHKKRMDGQLLARVLTGPGRSRDDPASDPQVLAAVRRTQAILERIADGVYVTDPDGTIRLWNRGAEELTGCPARHASGKRCADVLGLSVRGLPLDCKDGCALLQTGFERNASGGVETEAERDLPRGQSQHVLVTACGVEGTDGQLTEIVHTLRDLTALKRADEAKTMFLSTASHELKTPLTVILGYTQVLLDGWLEDDQRENALRTIEGRAKELSKIVDRLLLTGRIESGRVALSMTVVCLREVIPERADSLAAATDRTISYLVPEDFPAVIGDVEALTTVIDHVLDNAVKYSPDGGDVHVDVTADESGAEISIADSGIGMNDEGVAHCFDRFWQAESSDVRRFGGTGVGLYIVRSLVESMGGKVRVRSMPGAGTTFTVRLHREGAIV